MHKKVSRDIPSIARYLCSGICLCWSPKYRPEQVLGFIALAGKGAAFIFLGGVGQAPCSYCATPKSQKWELPIGRRGVRKAYRGSHYCDGLGWGEDYAWFEILGPKDDRVCGWIVWRGLNVAISSENKSFLCKNHSSYWGFYGFVNWNNRIWLSSFYLINCKK